MDIARNSLVAVFLRALERHCGVLILTTNRIKSFDEAFLSRISCGAFDDSCEIADGQPFATPSSSGPLAKRSGPRCAADSDAGFAWRDQLVPGWGQRIAASSLSQFLVMAGTSVGSKSLANGTTTAVGDASPPLKAGSVVTEKELEKLSEPILNGRVIKQLVRAGTAIALAADMPLGYKHLRIVLDHQQQFQDDWTTADTVRRASKLP